MASATIDFGSKIRQTDRAWSIFPQAGVRNGSAVAQAAQTAGLSASVL